ncbi:NTP transferase domain-containing protein [bacterium]|nr:NTP transferase domain-containing protein [bacterium]
MEFLENDQRDEVTKGIIFAADSGTQLYPMTQSVAKELLPVHGKPMVYYPLATLMLAGIRDILIVAPWRELRSFMELLGNGSRLGVSISYTEQPVDDGIAQSLLTAERFIGDDSVCLIHGDSIFHGDLSFLRSALPLRRGARLFACGPPCEEPKPSAAEGVDEENHSATSAVFHIPSGIVEDAAAPRAERYAVVEFDGTGKALRLGKSHAPTPTEYTGVGLYIFDNEVVEIAKSLRGTSCHAVAGAPLQAAAVSSSAARFTPGSVPALWEVGHGPELLSHSEGNPSPAMASDVAADAAPPTRRQVDIADLAREYLLRHELHVIRLGSHTVWLDANNHSGLLKASNRIADIEKQEGVKVGCIEEAAFKMGFIDAKRIERLARDLPENGYREYLMGMAKRASK